jgi:hypothetical protein
MSRYLENKVCDIVLSNPKTVSLLERLESLGLEEWALSGGAIRNEIWNNLHSYKPGECIRDYDITYLGTASMFTVHEELPVEWTSIDEVHEWYLKHRNVTVRPFTDLEDVCAFWPEICSCICLYSVKGDFKVIAPHGLEDLFELICRPNPVRFPRNLFNISDYYYRVHKMGIREKYPKVTIKLNIG